MQKEPNWSAFYKQLRKLGPLMLKGVPEEYKWWVEETAVDTDKFGKFTQERFYTYWGWSETLENRRDAVLETLKQWASNVKRELYYILEIYEESPQKCERLRSQVANIRLEPKVELLKNLLECALLPEDSSIVDGLPVEYLPFELLPSGSSNINDMISRLQREISQLPHRYRERSIDRTRLTKINTLEPDKCYIGTEKWRGYILFEFLSKDKIILECPIEGNATYILTGEWDQMVQHSKYYLRQKYPDRCVRVIHKGNWLDRVRDALTEDK